MQRGLDFAIIKSVIVMVYVCDNCGALFSRTDKQRHCPDCGKDLIRPANQVERREFISRMAGLLQKKCADHPPRFPSMVETVISMVDCFTFQLPVTALQIDNSLVVELWVEFGQNADDWNDLTANVWAVGSDRQSHQFLMSIHLPMNPKEVRREQVDRIFSALSGNRTFVDRLLEFVTEQLSI